MPIKERIVQKGEVITGYAARAKGTNKWLRNYWSGGAQTGTNMQSLTDDKTKMSIDTKKEIELYCYWYNKHHKKPVEFELAEVKMFTETTIDFTIL